MSVKIASLDLVISKTYGWNKNDSAIMPQSRDTDNFRFSRWKNDEKVKMEMMPLIKVGYNTFIGLVDLENVD